MASIHPEHFHRKQGRITGIMAGRVRQPIDEAAFEKYISENVPAIKTPFDLKQVSHPNSPVGRVRIAEPSTLLTAVTSSSASVNRIPHTRSRPPTASAS